MMNPDTLLTMAACGCVVASIVMLTVVLRNNEGQERWSTKTFQGILKLLTLAVLTMAIVFGLTYQVLVLHVNDYYDGVNWAVRGVFLLLFTLVIFHLLNRSPSSSESGRWWRTCTVMTMVLLLASSLSAVRQARLEQGYSYNRADGAANRVVGWEAINQTFSAISVIAHPSTSSSCRDTIITNCTWFDDGFTFDDVNDVNDATGREQNLAWFANDHGNPSHSFTCTGGSSLSADSSSANVFHDSTDHVHAINVIWNTYTCRASWETPYLFWDDIVSRQNRTGHWMQQIMVYGIASGVLAFLSVMLFYWSSVAEDGEDMAGGSNQALLNSKHEHGNGQVGTAVEASSTNNNSYGTEAYEVV